MLEHTAETLRLSPVQSASAAKHVCSHVHSVSAVLGATVCAAGCEAVLQAAAYW